MKIGFIRQEQMQIKDANKEVKTVKWLECYFRMAGAIAFQVKMSKNKKDENSTNNQPDFNLYMRTNLNKSDSFRDIAIGALWLGSKEVDGEMLNFMTGSIESPLFGKISIAVWKAKPNSEGEVVQYLYDINTMDDKKEESSSSHQQYQAPQAQIIENMPTIDIDNDEIPF